MKIKIGILFGGISNERNVSLNSARSVFDHLSNVGNTEISLIFVNKKEAFYKIEPRYIYSSSSSDFDFKIDKIATKIALSKIKNECDIVLPILHGAFGEDGTIQKILKYHKINFIGSDEKSCEKMFYKTAAIDIMRKNEINVFDSIVIHKNDSIEKSVLKINNFLKQNGKVIIKPDNSGSSIDVFASNDVKEIIDFIKNHDYKTFLIEKFCKKGTEFTVSVLEKENNPIALVPSSVALKKGDIYDYSKKYLPTETVMVSQPSIFNLQTIEKIQKEAIKIFKIFGAKDFLRIDGFYENGEIFFTDLNPICGMEQNGFFFQQISFIGISHRNAILNLMRMKMQKAEPEAKIDRKKVFVMMGGQSNEKNISILSGINIFLKLQKSAKYTPKAFFIDSKNKVYSLPDYIL